MRSKTGNDHRRARTQVSRTHRCTLQVFHALNNGALALYGDLCAHALQLFHIAETVFPHALI